jgi:hypothetical protein
MQSPLLWWPVYEVFRERGAAPDVRQTYVQVILRYTAEGSTTRNDLQIGPVSLDSAYLADTWQATQKDTCFGLLASLQKTLGAVALTLAPRDRHSQPADASDL